MEETDIATHNRLSEISDQEIIRLADDPQECKATDGQIERAQNLSAQMRAQIVDILRQEYLFRFGRPTEATPAHYIEIVARMM